MKLIYRGKVRDVYEVDKDRLFLAATDRISCFDYILPTPIPGKGRILTEISVFWFNYLKAVVKNHIISTDWLPENENKTDFLGCGLLVKKTERIDIECIVRGYLTGSALAEYKKNGTVSGIKIKPGLKDGARLPEIIFTPSKKMDSGHDVNITEKEAKDFAGKEVMDFLKEKSIMLYEKGSDYARGKGIVIADTKFEFGKIDNEIILIDELLTPDSSRFWDLEEYRKNKLVSFDKQFVRNYLIDIKWNQKPPVPELPEKIVNKTIEKYNVILDRICGKR